MKTNYKFSELNFTQKLQHGIGFIFYKVGYGIWWVGYKISDKILTEVRNKEIEY